MKWLQKHLHSKLLPKGGKNIEETEINIQFKIIVDAT